MTTLTKKQKTDYINGGYNNCPHCNSDDISAGHPEADDNYVAIDVECKKCKKEWKEIFTLVDIEDKD